MHRLHRPTVRHRASASTDRTDARKVKKQIRNAIFKIAFMARLMSPLSCIFSADAAFRRRRRRCYYFVVQTTKPQDHITFADVPTHATHVRVRLFHLVGRGTLTNDMDQCLFCSTLTTSAEQRTKCIDVVLVHLRNVNSLASCLHVMRLQLCFRSFGHSQPYRSPFANQRDLVKTYSRDLRRTPRKKHFISFRPKLVGALSSAPHRNRVERSKKVK